MPTWPSSAAAWPACRRPSNWPTGLQRRAAGGAPASAGASGRNGGQAIARPGLRPVGGRIRARPRRRAALIWNMTMEALRLIGERRARFGIECDWRGGYLGLAVSERKGARTAHGTTRCSATTATGRAGSPRRCRSGSPARVSTAASTTRGRPPAPAQVQHGHRRRRADAWACASTRIPPSPRSSPGGRATTPQGSVGACTLLLAGNVYLQGIAPVLESRVMPVGTYIVASEALDPAAQPLIPSGSACATPISCSTTSAPRPTTACSTAAGSATAPPRR